MSKELNNEHLVLYKKKKSLEERLLQINKDLKSVYSDIEKLGLNQEQKEKINELLTNIQTEDFFEGSATADKVLVKKQSSIQESNEMYLKVIEQSKAFATFIQNKHKSQKEYLSTLREIRRAHRDIEKLAHKKKEQSELKSNKHIKKSVNIEHIRKIGIFIVQISVLILGFYLILSETNSLTGTFFIVFACVLMVSSTFSFKFFDKFEFTSNKTDSKN